MAKKQKDKLELIGKVYDKNDLIIGEIHMWTVSHKFEYVPKKGKKIESDSLMELTDKKMKDNVKWMYIRYRRNKVFDLKDHTKSSKEKKPCWRSEEFYGS